MKSFTSSARLLKGCLYALSLIYACSPTGEEATFDPPTASSEPTLAGAGAGAGEVPGEVPREVPGEVPGEQGMAAGVQTGGGEFGGFEGGLEGGERPALSSEEWLVMRHPVGPDRRRFDCRAASDFEPPVIAERDPLCPLDLSCERRLIVAHRGAGGNLGYLAPENSLSAIRVALLMGVDGVELDVRTSADDQLVVIHDSTVDRTTSGTGEVEMMSLMSLKALTLTSPALRHPEAERGEFSCERIPTLQEALELTRGALFVDLDMKTSRVDLVVPLLAEMGLFDEVYVSVSNPEVAAAARALDARVRVQVRPDSPTELTAIDSLFAAFSALAAGRSPEIIEVPSTELEVFRPLLEGRDARLFTDGWGADLRAHTGDLSAYIELYERGAEVVQSELPLLILEALGRSLEP